MENEGQELSQEVRTEETEEEIYQEIQTGIDEVSEREQNEETDNLKLFMELEKQAHEEREQIKVHLEEITSEMKQNNQKIDSLIYFYENDTSSEILETQTELLATIAEEATTEETVISEELTEIETVQLYGNVSIIVILFLIVIALLYKLINSIFSTLTRHIG